MYFDISSQNKAMQFLVEFTKLPQADIDSFLEKNTVSDGIRFDTTNATAKNLVQESGINLSTFNTMTIEALAIHYTSNNDENISIKQYGLGDLQYALNKGYAAQTLLAENEIYIIYPNRKVMYYKEKEYDITYTQYNSKCPITGVARKVYFDNQVSCFFRIKDIESYLGGVDKRPEILLNLDDCFKDLHLSRKWAQQSQGYEIKYYAALSEFELHSFYDSDRMALSLIDLALSVVSKYDNGEVFAYMKPTTIISPQRIASITAI